MRLFSLCQIIKNCMALQSTKSLSASKVKLCMTLPPVMHLKTSLADEIALKTWHLILQEVEQTAQLALDIWKEKSFLHVVFSILLWTKQGRLNNFVNF